MKLKKNIQLKKEKKHDLTCLTCKNRDSGHDSVITS